MKARTAALSGALLLVAVLGGLTLYVIADTGLDVLTVLSLAIIAMFGFGVIGAILNPPGR